MKPASSNKKNLKTRLCGEKGTFRNSVIILASGAAGGQLLIMLTSPMITRLYTPGHFGDFTLYCTVLNVILVVASLRYDVAIPLPKEDSVAINVVALAMSVLILVTSLTLGIMYFFQGALHDTAFGKLSSCSWLLPLTLFFAGTYQVFNTWAVRKASFKSIAKTRLSQSFGQVVVQVGSGFCNIGLPGLIVGDLIGRVSGIGVLGRSLLRPEIVKEVSLPRMLKAAARFRSFPLLSSVSALFNAAALQLPFLLLAQYYGATVLGLFALSYRVIGGPLTLLGTSVGQVYMAEASRLRNESPEKLKKLLTRTSLKLFLLGLAPMLALVISSQWIFPAIFGKPWQEAGVYLQLMAPMFLLQFVVVPTSQTLSILERQGLQFLWDFFRLGSVWATLYFAHSMKSSPREVITFLSITMSACYIVSYVMISAACGSAAKIKIVPLAVQEPQT